MAYRLAQLTGRLDVDGVLAELSHAQLREWMAFYHLEPWGFPAADYHAARAAMMFHNAHAKSPASLAEYLRQPFPDAEPEQSAGDMLRVIRTAKAIAKRGG